MRCPIKTRSTIKPFIVIAVGLVGCRQEMYDQPKLEPYEESGFFPDRIGDRPQVEGTIARDELYEDRHFYFGKLGKDFVETYPFEIKLADLKHGQERFNIYCSPCHGRTGLGNGMIVQRGYRKPPSFHDDRSRDLKPGFIFDVITNGYATMPAYGDRVPPGDRWRIVAYIRALQQSRNIEFASLPTDVQAQLTEQP